MKLRGIASRNQVWRSYLGMGYHGTLVPPVVQVLVRQEGEQGLLLLFAGAAQGEHFVDLLRTEAVGALQVEDEAAQVEQAVLAPGFP